MMIGIKMMLWKKSISLAIGVTGVLQADFARIRVAGRCECRSGEES